MAKDAKAAAVGTEQAAPPRNKKLLIIILAAMLVLVFGGGGAAFFLLKKSDEVADDEDAVETAPAKKKEKKAKDAHPTFVNLEPFTVNLMPEAGDQYLQVTLSIEFEEATAEQLVKVHMPRIRNNVTLMLSGKKPSELLSKEGKENLAVELRDTINAVLEPSKRGQRPGDGPAKEVLFTSFIIQ